MTIDVEQAVLAFMDCWRRSDLDGALARIAPDAVFRPDPAAEETVGRDALRTLWGSYMRAISTYEFEVIHLLGRDGVAFLERVERFSTPDGRQISLPLIGIYEFDQAGLITRWQDYWDPKMSPPPPAAA